MAESKGSPLLRKHSNDLKEHLIKTIAFNMTEIEYADDLEGWFEAQDEDLNEKEDPAAISGECLYRLSIMLGEKTILKCCSDILK